jgi:hypothetical protein
MPKIKRRAQAKPPCFRGAPEHEKPETETSHEVISGAVAYVDSSLLPRPCPMGA